MNIREDAIQDLKRLDNESSIPVIYNRYGKKLYAYVLTNCNVTEDDAWNLIYKTLHKVVDSYHNYEFENEEKFTSFILKIFINCLRNHYNQLYRKVE